MEIICPTCGVLAEKSSIEVEKARINGRKIYCSKRCSNLGRTKYALPPSPPCAYCGKLLTDYQQFKGNKYCSRICAHKCISHARVHSVETKLQIGKSVKAYQLAHPEEITKAHRGQREHTLSTGKVIPVDSYWEAEVYEFLLKYCSLPWSYANENPFFVNLGEFNWRPDFVIRDFQKRFLLLEVKGHPKAIELFESSHYPLIKSSERCQRDFYIGLLTHPPWELKLARFEDLLEVLEWILPPAEGMTPYVTGMQHTASTWKRE